MADRKISIRVKSVCMVPIVIEMESIVYQTNHCL